MTFEQQRILETKTAFEMAEELSKAQLRINEAEAKAKEAERRIESLRGDLRYEEDESSDLRAKVDRLEAKIEELERQLDSRKK